MSLTKRIQPMMWADRSLTQKGVLSVALVLALIGSLEVDASSVYRGRRGRSLTTDAEIAQIRRNIAEFATAGKIADNIVRAADEWVARPDRVLWELIPTSDVPRAFNSSFEGCPIHGMEYFKHGNYSWKMDPFGKPWKIVCPVGGEEYPSNDFLAFYKSGMKDRSLLTGDYPDDGWGWRKPGDEKKHWFVAYYCHWLWRNYIVRGVGHLAYAYEITGDERYARKAIVMLDRIAEVYPAMDYSKQSRYAAEFRPSYSGKIVNYIWENSLVSVLAFAYGGAFDLLAQEGTWPDKNSPLYGKSYAEIRQNIENNILRVAVAGVSDGRIRGNYGMHQRTLGHLAIVLQDDALTKRVVDYILNNSTGDAAVEGFNYALDNFVFREGISFETAPGYCLGWSANLATVAELLDQLGVDVFASPKLKRMLTAYLELQVLRRFTPAVGDSGGVRSGAVRLPPVLAKLGLRKFRDPVFAKYLLEGGVFGAKSFKTYADLKLPPLDEAELRRAARGASDTFVGSRNLGGYGLAILENGNGDDGVGVAVSYGPAAAGHAHFDRLFFELYGYGKGLIPDLGYPQFAAEAKDPAAWERNTLSHCTVTIDAKRQATKRKGSLHLFAGLPDVQVLDVSAPEAYPHVRTYRRMMLLIGEEPESAYVVDFFRVEGGRSHDYSLHGFDGDFSTTGIQLSPPQEKGTLAGEDVAYSFLYDDADLEKPGKTRSYHTYQGSGYSYLYNVQRAVPSGTWTATWEDKEVGIHAIFPTQGTHEAVVANGNPPKRRGNPESLKYILLRNSGEEGLSSSFVCVLQPFRMRGGRKPAPLAVRTIKAYASGAILLEIGGDSGLDYVWLGGNPNEAVEVGGLSIRATCAVVRLDAEGRLRSVSLAGGGHVKQGLLSFELGPEVQGIVTGVDVEENRLVIEACNPLPDVGDLVGQTAIFGASGRSRNYRIQDAWSDRGRLVLALGNDIPRTGKFAVENIDPDGRFVTTKTVLYLAAGGHYKGAWLANEDHTAWHRIVDVSKGKIELMTPTHLESQLTDRDGDGRVIAYLYDVGPGEQVTVPAVGWIGPDASGEWRLQANCPARIPALWYKAPERLVSMQTYIFFSLIILLVFSSQILPADVTVHPRLYFAKEDLPRIRKSGFAAEQYLDEGKMTLKYFGGKMITFPLPPQQPGSIEEPPGFDAKKFGHYPYWTQLSRQYQTRMLYLSLAYAATGRKDYARTAIEYALALSKWNVWTDLDYSKDTCLDTCHITLGVAAVYDICHDAMTEEERAAIRDGMVRLGLEPLMANVSGRTEHNLQMLRASALGAGGLALLGDAPRAAEYVRAAKAYYQWFLDSRFTSSNTEGMLYTSYGMDNCMAFADMLNRVAGDDELIRHPFVEQIVRWAIYFQCPRASGLVNFSDSSIANYFATTMKVLSNSLAHGHAGWYLQKSNLSGGNGWAGVIYGNPKRAVTPPKDWPSSAVFPNIGWVALRSGWGEDDTLLAFQSSDSKMGHNHWDQNNFVLNHAGEWLITDPGYKQYTGGAKTFFGLHTVGHNSILVDGEGQDKVGGARVTSFFTSGLFDYAAGDASGSYSSARLSKFVRRIAHVKPGYFVMLDEVESEGTPRTFQWLLHIDKTGEYLFDGRPTNVGDSGQIRQIAVIKNKASVELTLLLPETRHVELVEYEGAEQYGPYVAVSPSEQRPKTRFLTALVPSKAGEKAQVSFSAIEGEGAVGVEGRGAAGSEFVAFRTAHSTSRVRNIIFVGESCLVRADDSGEVAAFALCEGRKLGFDGNALLLTSEKASVAVCYYGSNASADVSIGADTQVRFRVPGKPITVELDGRPAEFRFDAPSQMVIFDVPAGQHAASVVMSE